MEYPKIETLFDRDEKTHKVIMWKYRLPEFELIEPGRWLLTEKIDGTNVRIHLAADGQVRYYGRTEDAQMPTRLLSALMVSFPPEVMAKVWRGEERYDVWLFGEGFGPGIQSGGNLAPTIDFRLFDVFIGGLWLTWDNVQDIAARIGTLSAPTMAIEDVQQLIVSLREGIPSGMMSAKPGTMMEGVVARTEPLLLTRRGERLMWKLKTKDFPLAARKA